MARYVVRRLLQAIPVFFGATFLIFAMVNMMPGDPVAALGGDKALSPDVIARISAEHNLDKPLWLQYLLYLKGICTLDFGTMFSGQPVIAELGRAAPVTLKLGLMALAIEVILGITAGVIAGVRRNGIFDTTTFVVALFIISIPIFVTGFVLQYLVGVRWRLVPPTVGSDPSFKNLLLPALVLGIGGFAYLMRLTRSQVAENSTADFVRTARAKGLSNGVVLRKHVLRNSLIPIVTALGGEIGGMMGGALMTEGIFNIHGVGGLMWDSIMKAEPSTVVSLSTVLVVSYIVVNLLIDLLYAVLDPRIRYE